MEDGQICASLIQPSRLRRSDRACAFPVFWTKYLEIPRSTSKYPLVPRSTSKYPEVPQRTFKYPKAPVSTSKYTEDIKVSIPEKH